MAFRYDLNGQWEFASVKGKYRKWMPANVPGCLHTDLMSQGIIPDPFYRFNEHEAVLHERTDWKYRKRFHLDQRQFKALMDRRVRLVCQGLDTFATIKLNRNRVGNAENMFVEHEFDIKKLLKRGLNELVILFQSPIRVGDQLRLKYGRTSSGIPFDIRSYVRKAQYSLTNIWSISPNTRSCIWRLDHRT